MVCFFVPLGCDRVSANKIQPSASNYISSKSPLFHEVVGGAEDYYIVRIEVQKRDISKEKDPVVFTTGGFAFMRSHNETVESTAQNIKDYLLSQCTNVK